MKAVRNRNGYRIILTCIRFRITAIGEILVQIKGYGIGDTLRRRADRDRSGHIVRIDRQRLRILIIAVSFREFNITHQHCNLPVELIVCLRRDFYRIILSGGCLIIPVINDVIVIHKGYIISDAACLCTDRDLSGHIVRINRQRLRILIIAVSFCESSVIYSHGNIILAKLIVLIHRNYHCIVTSRGGH